MLALLDFMKPVIENCFESLLTVSLIGAVVVALSSIIHKMFGRQLSKRLLVLFWLVVLLRFIIFAAPESSSSFMNLVVSPDKQEHVELQTVTIARNLDLSDHSFDLVNQSSLSEAAANVPPRFIPISPMAIGATVWLSGVAMGLIFLVCSANSVSKIVKRSGPTTK